MSEITEINQVAASILKKHAPRLANVSRETLAQLAREELERRRAHTCATCEDQGLVRYEVPIDHELFGRLVACPEGCAASKRVISLQDVSGLFPSDYGRKWEDLLDLSEGGYNSAEGVELAKLTLARGWGWLFLFGNVGTSKTSILTTATASALRANKRALFLSMSEVLSYISEGYEKGKDESARERLEALKRYPVLALDEFEKFNETAWAKDKVFELLNYRWRRATEMRDQVTLFASNKAPEACRDSSIISRIRDERFFVRELLGEDLRRYAKDL